MNFEQSPEFKKDLKRLSKKWRSLPGDIADAELLITNVYTDNDQQQLFQQKFFDNKRATKLHTQGNVEVIKMRLDVISLAGADKVRIVFVAVKKEERITFVELFAKNEKDREDPGRYRGYI